MSCFVVLFVRNFVYEILVQGGELDQLTGEEFSEVMEQDFRTAFK